MVLCCSRHTYVYTHMLTARAVYATLLFLEWTSRPQADQAIERDKGV